MWTWGDHCNANSYRSGWFLSHTNGTHNQQHLWIVVPLRWSRLCNTFSSTRLRSLYATIKHLWIYLWIYRYYYISCICTQFAKYRGTPIKFSLLISSRTRRKCWFVGGGGEGGIILRFCGFSTISFRKFYWSLVRIVWHCLPLIDPCFILVFADGSLFFISFLENSSTFYPGLHSRLGLLESLSIYCSSLLVFVLLRWFIF